MDILPVHPPRKKTGGSSSPFFKGEEPRCGLPIPESKHWIWWERKKIGARPSHSLPLIHLRFPRAQLPLHPGAGTVRNAGENSLLKFSGSEAYAVGATHNVGSLPPRELTLHTSLPIRPCTKCMYRLRHMQAFYVAGLVTWQTTVNKTHRTWSWSWLTHTELCWMTKSSPTHDILPIVWTDYTYDSEHGIAEGIPLAFLTQLEFPEGNKKCFLS